VSSRLLVVAALLVATVGADAAPPLGSAPAAVPVRINLQSLTVTPTQLSQLSTWATTKGGPTTAEWTSPTVAQSVTETTIPISTLVRPVTAANGSSGACTPTITKAKGKLTSGGYLVIEGTCFGNSGQVVLSGFPNGDPQTIVQAWTPTAITVGLPSISGVPDLTMHVKVVSGSQSSQTFDANYVAPLGDPITLPGKYIVNNVCAPDGVCPALGIPVGLHWDYTPQNGTDVWTMKIPDHFQLQSIHLVHVTSGSLSTSTIVKTSSEVAFSVAWREEQPNGDQTAQHSNCSAAYAILFGPCGTTTVEIPTYGDTYLVEPQVVGPVGMKP
jgi:hypothetical protein